MIKSRRRLQKVKADSKRLIIRKMRPWYGILLAMLFSLMLTAPAIAVDAEAASGAQWSDDDLKIVRHPSTGAVKFLPANRGLKAASINLC
jgi:hypothetical protein